MTATEEPESRPRAIRNPLLINPFFLYAGICAAILGLYATGASLLYGPIDLRLLFFLTVTVFLSVAIGALQHRRIVRLITPQVGVGKSRREWRITALIAAAYLGQFAWAGEIPLLRVGIDNSVANYGEFQQIPVFGVLLTTFSIFYSTTLIYRIIIGRDHRLSAGLQFVAIQFAFLLLLNRGAIVICLLAASSLIGSRLRLTPRRVLFGLISVCVILFVFGGIGNVRESGSFSDGRHILALAHLRNPPPSWMPDQYVWSYMYTISPLGNLNFAVTHISPANSFAASFINVVPDFATKRVFPSFDPSTQVVVPYFNVSTGFGAAWKFNGFVGLSMTYAALVAFIGGATRACSDEWAPVALALGGGMMAFMFFENTLSYSGVSFALVFPVVASLFSVSPRGGRMARGPR